MNENEFNEQLQALHERVLSKAMSPEEEVNYTESLFDMKMNTTKNFGMPENFKLR